MRRAEEQAQAVRQLRRRAVYLALALVALTGLLLVATWLSQLAGRNAQAAQEHEGDGSEERPDVVHLRQRAAPLLDMLRRSAAAEREVTW